MRMLPHIIYIQGTRKGAQFSHLPPPDIVVILFESDGSFHNRGTPM